MSDCSIDAPAMILLICWHIPMDRLFEVASAQHHNVYVVGSHQLTVNNGTAAGIN
jgi:hypothetical protein